MEIRTRWVSEYIEIIVDDDESTSESNLLGREEAKEYLEMFQEVVQDLETFIGDGD